MKRAEIRDISVALSADSCEWPGDTPFSCGWTTRIGKSSSVNLSTITLSPHVGTHADAPLHVRDGWPGSHELPLDPFLGMATVVDVSHLEGEIPLSVLEQLLPGESPERILLRTGRSVASGSFPESWPTLSEACARELLGRGLILVGVDCPSVDERHSQTLPVHNMIFSGNACILENLDLRRIVPGNYELLAAPLKLMALDGAPVRAVLRELPE